MNCALIMQIFRNAFTAHRAGHEAQLLPGVNRLKRRAAAEVTEGHLTSSETWLNVTSETGRAAEQQRQQHEPKGRADI